VGEISDEYDDEEADVEVLGDGTLVVNARMPIDEVNELLESSGLPEGSLPEGDWDTVGGLIYTELGHVPTEGEEVDVLNHRLIAERVQGRRIGRVRIRQLVSADDHEDPPR
jgi:CBS domain containing-hemolysin-like protein